MKTITEIMGRAYAYTENGDGFDDPWQCYTGHTQAAIKALEANGFAIVPVEPTEAMIDAGRITANNMGFEDLYSDHLPALRFVIRAAIAAGNKP